MEKIIINNELTLFQKILLTGVSFLMFGITYNILNDEFLDTHGDLIEIPHYIAIFPFLAGIALFLILFIKKGLIVDDKKLYRAYFLLGKNIYKSQVDLTDITDVSIFKIRTKESVEYFRPGPGPAEFTNMFYKIYILNDRHTYKDLILESTDEELINYVVDFLQKELHLKLNPYNPRF